MWNRSRYGVVALLIAAACVAVAFVAVSTAGAPASRGAEGGAVPRGGSQTPRDRTSSGPSPAGSYACPECGSRVAWGAQSCPRCGWFAEGLMRHAALAGPAADPLRPAGPRALETPSPVARGGGAAPGVAASGPASALPSPREQDAAKKEFVEGHWLGLEVIPLTPELAKEYKVPNGETGVLVDEITLEAAESGILAGDMIQSVGGHHTPDLKAFFVATQRVREEGKTKVGISRRGSEKTFVIEARNTTELGFAQMEAAQPIMPGAISPHRSRGRPCTDCHIIMATGGQLPTDAGDILPTPPPITTNARAPHGNRGRCSTCHVVR